MTEELSDQILQEMQEAKATMVTFAPVSEQYRITEFGKAIRYLDAVIADVQSEFEGDEAEVFGRARDVLLVGIGGSVQPSETRAVLSLLTWAEENAT